MLFMELRFKADKDVIDDIVTILGRTINYDCVHDFLTSDEHTLLTALCDYFTLCRDSSAVYVSCDMSYSEGGVIDYG